MGCWSALAASLGLRCADQPEEPAGCLATPDGGLPLACCATCPPLIEGCRDPKRLSDFQRESTLRRQLSDDCLGSAYSSAGRCSNGMHFVSFGNGLINETHYFDAAGRFVGLEGSYDLVDEVCWGRWYWPEPIECDERTSVELLCPR